MLSIKLERKVRETWEYETPKVDALTRSIFLLKTTTKEVKANPTAPSARGTTMARVTSPLGHALGVAKRGV